MRPLLIEHALAVGMRHAADLTVDSRLLVEDGRIASMGDGATSRAAELESAGTAVERLNASGLWLLPGFVQTHVHLCQTLLRNGPDDLELLPWLTGHVWPGEAAHTPETLAVSARLGLAELLSGGTTAILDMGTVRHTDAVFEAAQASGMRVTSGNALMDDPSTNPPYLMSSAEWGLAETERLLARWHGAAQGRLRVAFCPRFAVSCTDATMREVGGRARRHGVLVHTHASENLGEVELVRHRTSRSNIRYLHDVGITGPNVVLAHVIHTDEEERELLAGSGTNVSHCPSSNLKLASGICPVPEYRARGIRVSLGADGAPCNDRLDIFSEMRMAALVQKPRLGPKALSAFEVVRMATAEGAAALGLHDCGTLEPGKRADLVLLDPHAGFAQPTSWREDPYGPIVYSFDRSHVVATYVDGVRRYHRSRPDLDGLAPTHDELVAAVETLKNGRPS